MSTSLSFKSITCHCLQHKPSDVAQVQVATYYSRGRVASTRRSSQGCKGCVGECCDGCVICSGLSGLLKLPSEVQSLGQQASGY